MGLKAVHFGGGNIGRGFVAEKLHLAGYEVVFVDVMDSIIEQLQKTKEYTVTEIGEEGEKVNKITNYRAINSKTHEGDVVEEISTADLVTCAVGPNILKFIAPVIGKAIDKRTAPKPIAVIACENAIGATDTLAGFIKDSNNTPQDRLASINDRASFANSAIDRIVPGQDPNAGLNVKIESFYEWVVDKTPFAKEGHPEISAIKWVDDLSPYIERKLFTVNTGHAAAAYYGHARGKRTIHDALQDPEINKIVHECLSETSHLIVKKHGISVDEQKAYVEKIVKRISNPYLEDVVERVGRAPLRKLSRKERFVGPASQLAESGDKVDALLGAIEQAFAFLDVKDDEESAELSKILKSTEAKEVVGKVCGLEDSHPLFSKIVPIVEKVQKSINGLFLLGSNIEYSWSMATRLAILTPELEVNAEASRSEQNTTGFDVSHSTGPLGIGLGPIRSRFLGRERWPLDTPERIFQYRKFVQVMIDRIRGGESNDVETRQFTHLIDFPDGWQYIFPTFKMLSELAEPGPLAMNEQMAVLVAHVKNFIDAKEKERIELVEYKPRGQPKPLKSAEAIKADVRDKVAKLLFGTKDESIATPAMKRLLTSWVDLGYPDKALEQITNTDSKRGRMINRDSLGLPYGLREQRSSSRYSGRQTQKKTPPDPGQPTRNGRHSSMMEPAGFTPNKHPPDSERPTPKISPGQHAQYVLSQQISSNHPTELTKKNSLGTYTPADSDSPPTSDDPPEDPHWESAESGSDTHNEYKPQKASFWDFVNTYKPDPDYREDVGPIPREIHANTYYVRKQATPILNEVTRCGTVVMKGFARQNPAISKAILKGIYKSAVAFSAVVAAQEQERMARWRHKIEEARYQKRPAANVNDENSCAIEDTTSESEREVEIGKKTKTPKSDRTPTSILSNSSTAAPTLTGPGSPRATEAGLDNGVNLEQVNQLLEDSDGAGRENTNDGVRVPSDESPHTAYRNELKREYAKLQAKTEGASAPEKSASNEPALEGSVEGYDAGPSA
ncbi:MAG: hypothetical protein Q9213_008299 [Squamulea squamosa]